LADFDTADDLEADADLVSDFFLHEPAVAAQCSECSAQSPDVVRGGPAFAHGDALSGKVCVRGSRPRGTSS
jgi:hypothetical protein